MARVKRGVTSKAKHKKVLKAVKGQWGRRKNTIRVAKQAMEKAMQYAYRDRRNKKRDFKSLWIQRINAGVRAEGLTYSKFINGLNKSGQGRNCCSACVCTLGPALASYVPVVGMCCYCSTCCYDIPDRMDFGKQNYLEACFSVSCCCNVPGRVQLAQQLGVKPWNFEEIKRDTSASADHFKSDVMLRNL